MQTQNILFVNACKHTLGLIKQILFAACGAERKKVFEKLSTTTLTLPFCFKYSTAVSTPRMLLVLTWKGSVPFHRNTWAPFLLGCFIRCADVIILYSSCRLKIPQCQIPFFDVIYLLPTKKHNVSAKSL